MTAQPVPARFDYDHLLRPPAAALSLMVPVRVEY
jgi:hypothetical protein